MTEQKKSKQYRKGFADGEASVPECDDDHVEGAFAFFFFVGLVASTLVVIAALVFAVNLVLTAIDDHQEVGRLQDQIARQQDDFIEFSVPYCQGIVLFGVCDDTNYNAPQKGTRP